MGSRLAARALNGPEMASNVERADEPGCPRVLRGAVPLDKRRENRGGYDCEFVEPPPEAFQTECPVCMLILKEPCLISCCGHKFCRVCIERVKKDDKPCPLCCEPDFISVQERSLERFLKESQVWCSYKKDGCEWKGKLGELEQHLNQNPSSENQLNGCQFVEVECTYKCGEWFQRHHITSHETEQCKKRPYSCDYCRDYESTFEDVTEIHYPQCSKYPIACPNECRVYKFERQELESHLQDQCPLTLVDCPFHYAGCQTQLPRKDMPEHMRETATHLTLLASVTQNLVKENQELRQTTAEQQQTIAEIRQKELQYQEQQRVADKELQTLKEENQQHQDEQKAIEREIQILKKSNQQLTQKVTMEEADSQKRTTAVDETLQRMDRKYHNKLQTTIAEVQTLKKEMQQLQERADKSSNNMDALMRRMDQHYQDKQKGIEQKVQTLKQETKQLQQRANVRYQQYQERQTNIEQRVQALKKETVSLDALLQGKDQRLKAIDEEVQTLKNQQSVAVRAVERSTRVLQINQRQYHVQLKAAEDEIQTLQLEVCKLNLPHSLVNFRVERTDDNVYSPAFYTHPHGYQMCLRVYANGHGDGEGTHVSIFTHMMRGLFDDHLKWPFRGEITIQIVNQAGDHDHYEMAIPYNDKTPDTSAGRVTDKERSDGWGFHEFLAHDDLPSDIIKMTQYLKDNHIVVCVTKVKLTTT